LVRHFATPRISDYLRITVGTNTQTDFLLAALARCLDKGRAGGRSECLLRGRERLRLGGHQASDFIQLAGAMSGAAAFRSIEPEEKLLPRDARGISCRLRTDWRDNGVRLSLH
jgi:hypothetical protein